MNATLSTQQLRLVALLLGRSRPRRRLPGRHAQVDDAEHADHSQDDAGRDHPGNHDAGQAAPAHAAKLSTHGLPVPVARALQHHSVVVVALRIPGSDVDATTTAEAQAGAKAAKAGFVKIDVFAQKSGTAMLRKLGVVDTPVVLVVERPASIDSEFRGLVDRTVVAQAVAEAR